jgi:D-3-phosphoglycerate dehydrogenase / 2-oxoglutarate reductase
MNRVLIGPAPLRDIPDTYLPTLTAAGFEPVFPKRAAQMTEAELSEQIVGCVAALAGSEPYTPAVLAKAAAGGLKVIARAGVGYDGINVPAATTHGIPVTIAVGSNHNAVAEYVFMAMLNFAKQTFEQNALTKAGKWPRRAVGPLRGRTVGVIGVGRIGRRVVQLARAFDMNVIAAEIVPDFAFLEQHGTRLVSTDEVFREADFVTVHTPLTALTRGLVNARTLSLMKQTAMLINSARGEIVDEPALAEALASKRIAGAAIDVFEDEPAPVTNPLFVHENMLATAHIAGVDRRSIQDMASFAAQAIVRVLNGDWPSEWVVNPEVRK